MQRRHPKHRLAIAEVLRSQRRACDGVAEWHWSRATVVKGFNCRDKRGQKGGLGCPVLHTEHHDSLGFFRNLQLSLGRVVRIFSSI